MSDIFERVEQVFKNEGLSERKFIMSLGFAPSTYNTAKKRKSGLGHTFIQKFKEAYPNLSLDWLVMGKGEMWATDKVKVYQEAMNNFNMKPPEIDDYDPDKLEKMKAFLIAYEEAQRPPDLSLEELKKLIENNKELKFKLDIERKNNSTLERLNELTNTELSLMKTWADRLFKCLESLKVIAPTEEEHAEYKRAMDNGDFKEAV